MKNQYERSPVFQPRVLQLNLGSAGKNTKCRSNTIKSIQNAMGLDSWITFKTIDYIVLNHIQNYVVNSREYGQQSQYFNWYHQLFCDQF